MLGLFGRAQRPAHGEPLENVVGPTSSVTGTLRSDGGVRIDGAFEGTIEVAGNVVVGVEGRVTGDITARNVIVGGVVNGDIYGTGQLQILSTGKVFGDISVASVTIDDGGVFQGASRMRGLEQPALAPPRDGAAEAPPQDERATQSAADERTVEGTARLAEDRADAAASGGEGQATVSVPPAPEPAEDGRASKPRRAPAPADDDFDLDLDALGI